jgi:hypothetical protein
MPEPPKADAPVPGRPPPVVLAAIVLIAPATILWPVAGTAFVVSIARTESSAKALWWALALLVFALCLFVGYMGARGMFEAWRGVSKRIRVPAIFTLSIFFVAIVNLLVKGKIEYDPTQILPLVVGALAGLALFLTRTPDAEAWFNRPR